MTNDPDKLYLFVHVPKTAGTSFRLAVEKAFPSAIAYDYAPKAPETSAAVRRFVYDDKDFAALRRWLEVEDKVLLGGHFHFRKYSAIFEPSRVIAFVREPVARIVSEYEHAKRHQGFEGELLEFASRPRNKNLQSGMLAGVGLEEAAFVGVTERYPLSLRLLQRRVGWRLEELVRNVNPKARSIATLYKPSPEEEAQLRAWNERDIELYARVNDQLDARESMA